MLKLATCAGLIALLSNVPVYAQSGEPEKPAPAQQGSEKPKSDEGTENEAKKGDEGDRGQKKDASAKKDAAGEKGEAGDGDKDAAKKPTKFTVGKKVDPKITLQDIHGKTHVLGKYAGKTLVVVFYSIQCPYMRPALPKLKAIQEEYGKKDVQVLAVNSNRTEIGLTPQKKIDEPGGTMQMPYLAQREHHKKNKVNFPVLVDHGNKIADLFQATTTPHCFVIDAKGVLRYEGAIDDDPRGRKGDKRTPYVRQALDAVLAGEKVLNAETKQYGCTIKRAKGKKRGGERKKSREIGNF